MQLNDQKEYYVYHPFRNHQYKELAAALLNQSKYNQKMILICWHHGHANRLAQALGVTQTIPKWPHDAFDTVYVLRYDANGKLSSFQILKNQYPVNQNPSWESLAAA